MLLALLVVLATPPVSGRLVDADSNKPIAGAHVMLVPERNQTVPPDAIASLEAVTGVDGRFLFDGVPPGQYRIDVQMAGFVPLGDERPAVDTTAGQPIAGIELFLKKGGAITGRIVNAGGDPLPWITVSALKQAAEPPAGHVMAMAVTAQMAQTNDLGEFRLAGLAEGSYLLIASPPPQPPFAQSTPGNVALAPTYYPGTTDKEAAQIVIVGSAQTVSDLQFSLVSTPAYQVSGIVVDEAGSPLGGAMLALMLDVRDGGTGAPATGRSDESGMFRIGGVAPGTYRLMASMPMMWSAQAGASPDAAAGGVVAVTGGVYFGGAGAGGPGVPPPSGIAVGTPIDVTIDNADVSGLRIVLTTRK